MRKFNLRFWAALAFLIGLLGSQGVGGDSPAPAPEPRPIHPQPEDIRLSRRLLTPPRDFGIMAEGMYSEYELSLGGDRALAEEIALRRYRENQKVILEDQRLKDSLIPGADSETTGEEPQPKEGGKNPAPVVPPGPPDAGAPAIGVAGYQVTRLPDGSLKLVLKPQAEITDGEWASLEAAYPAFDGDRNSIHEHLRRGAPEVHIVLPPTAVFRHASLPTADELATAALVNPSVDGGVQVQPGVPETVAPGAAMTKPPAGRTDSAARAVVEPDGHVRLEALAPEAAGSVNVEPVAATVQAKNSRRVGEPEPWPIPGTLLMQLAVGAVLLFFAARTAIQR